ncbi:MAG: hypothetical protein ABSF47_01665 [Minisyncoccia bacterium]|jgi:hypothetical protein
MSRKTLVWLGLFIGSTIGSFIPELWGSDVLSFSSIILSALGGLAGIWIGFKFGE